MFPSKFELIKNIQVSEGRQRSVLDAGKIFDRLSSMVNGAQPMRRRVSPQLYFRIDSC